MGGFRKTFGRIDDAIARAEDLFIIVAHGGVAGLVILAVVLRYVFNDPLTWGEELIVGLFIWMVFVGAAAAVRSQMHIRIDVMGPVFRNPKMYWLNTMTLVIGIVIIVTLVWACYEQVLQELVVESPMLGVSKAWFAAAMPAGMVLMLMAGYVGPGLIGLGAAVLLAAGYAVAVLWLLLVLLALLLVQIRNWFGLWSILVTGAMVSAVSWFASEEVQSGFAYLVTWFLLLGAPRPVIELHRSRRGRARDSDADQLARLTGVPPIGYVCLFLVVTVGALCVGGWWLLTGELGQ